MRKMHDSIRVLDRDGIELSRITKTEARRLTKRGEGHFFSNASGKVKGLRLTKSLEEIGSAEPQRPLSISSVMGTQFLFRKKITTPDVNFSEFSHKHMLPEESSNAALLRMMPGLKSRRLAPRQNTRGA